MTLANMRENGVRSIFRHLRDMPARPNWLDRRMPEKGKEKGGRSRPECSRRAAAPVLVLNAGRLRGCKL
jgi:hypothetical protein